MTKEEKLIALDLVRSTGHTGTTVYVGKHAEIVGRTVFVDDESNHESARNLAQIARRNRESMKQGGWMPVVTIVTNEADQQLVAGVSGEFNFRTKKH
jgi:hypothetical protein